ncbi:MAG: hypothetical protein LBS25_09310 [Candidatus Symbiothrix sp.]|jgi:hypothetical protein|nr:hypothetical protein [Candidatus Symbiothrix sp.]
MEQKNLVIETDATELTFEDIMALNEEDFLDYKQWLWHEWVERHKNEIDVSKHKPSLTGRIAFVKGAGKYIINSLKHSKK